MKNTIFALAITSLFTTVLVLGCKPATKDEVSAQENLKIAEENVVKAKRAATAEEWNSFKLKADSLLHENELEIASLKLNFKKTKSDADTAYKKNINELEQKNNDFKVKIEDYKNDVNSDWESFERESKYDMQELGKALKNVMVNNKK